MSPLDVVASPATDKPVQDPGANPTEHPVGGKQYWRSLGDLQNSPEFEEFLHREFPVAASEFPQGVSRRRWLQLMSASFALAGAAGCRWEKENILPEAQRVPGRIPGVPVKYATAADFSGAAHGLLVTSFDGRPIKVDGNPQHPQNQGASDIYTQASILQLYDPDRSQVPAKRGENVARTWAEAEAALREAIGKRAAVGGAGLRVLAEPSSSPTLAALRKKFAAAFPQAKWVAYEPLQKDAVQAGAQLAFGKPVRTHLNLDQADVIVTLDADLLRPSPQGVKLTRQFAAGRVPTTEGRMNRLYSIDSYYSRTAAMADHRLAVRNEQVVAVAVALEVAVLDALGTEVANKYGPRNAPPQGGILAEEPAASFIRELAADLVAHKGRTVVAVGSRQPAAVHALVHRLNAALGNVGTTVAYTDEPAAGLASPLAEFKSLMDEMHAGQVDTLLILGGNPVYNAPADFAFEKALEKVPNSFHLGLYRDETGDRVAWHMPQAHFLESWGDARAYDGLYSIVQPLIEPLYQGRTTADIVSLVVTLATDAAAAPVVGQDLVRATFAELSGSGTNDAAWRLTLHDGYWAGSNWPTITPALQQLPPIEITGDLLAKEVSKDDLEILFRQSDQLYDGRYANIAWLQELPDFMTKVTWDNVALMSKATADCLGIATHDVHTSIIHLKYRGKEATIPVYVMPGHADGSVTVSLGYGRTAVGSVGGDTANGTEPVGVDFYAFRTSDAMDFARGLTVSATPGRYHLATTQDHHALDAIGSEGRDQRMPEIIRETDLESFKQHPDFAKHVVHVPEVASLWDRPRTDVDYKWGMSIDLSKCIGCNACVIACQAENNIPVVGREQVRRGREMHWIRLDRYYSGDFDQAKVVHQPVACQQCEDAPCEQVCPVAATVHSDEGLNDMVYNRCIGTRYCSNNCPYKVRRFNYFNFQKQMSKPDNLVLKMLYNPEVTVRSRGVMEKCTFCVQRIQNAKIVAKTEHRPIADGEVQSACQQACPAQAIVFGDLNDPQSQVTALHADQRSYQLLEELSTKPRNRYLARITNPNPKLAPAADKSHEQHSPAHV
ncbi:MAG: TAT-variant-translocated molybdopterin oxidoreductase [Pirellulales bacterium]|nr:TAT-variant-translocated molybdopterin oxidoreductase [Pirellulales bacterium]